MKNILIFALVVILSACQPRTAGPHISENEIWAEQQYQKKMVAEEKLDNQHKTEEKKIEMAQRLLRVSKKISKSAVDMCMEFRKDNSSCVFKYSVIDDKGINAFADGSEIKVTKGMMNFLRDDDELAFVVAHEYAHNMMDHIPSKSVNVIAGAVIGALMDGLIGNPEANFTKAGAELGSLAYSQDFETEADYVGLYIAQIAGYNIKKAPDIWRRMSLKNPDAIYIGVTHPANAERFVAMEKMVKEIKQKKKSGQKLTPELLEESIWRKPPSNIQIKQR